MKNHTATHVHLRTGYSSQGWGHKGWQGCESTRMPGVSDGYPTALNMWDMDQMDSYSSGKHIAHDPVIPPLDTYQEKREHMFTNRLT